MNSWSCVVTDDTNSFLKLALGYEPPAPAPTEATSVPAPLKKGTYGFVFLCLWNIHFFMVTVVKLLDSIMLYNLHTACTYTIIKATVVLYL